VAVWLSCSSGSDDFGEKLRVICITEAKLMQFKDPHFGGTSFHYVKMSFIY